MKAQPILIDFDGTADFLMAVRLRDVICPTINPLHADMGIFDRRVRRADCFSEKQLRQAVGELAREMADAIFYHAKDKTYEWATSPRCANSEPLSDYEATVLVQTFLGIAAQARGEDPRPFVDGSFSLIAEDDGVTKAKASAAANLPPGRVIGANGAVRPIAPADVGGADTAPQPEGAAAAKS